MESRCTKPYEESTQLWGEMVADEQLKELAQNMRKEQETNEKLRDSLTTLSTTMKMKKIK